MVPFADFINHHNVDSSYELISKDQDPKLTDEEIRSLPKAYFTQSKREVDYTDFYKQEKEEQECEIEDFKISNNRSLNYIRLVETRKEAKNTQSTLSKLIHSTPTNIWDVNYLSTSDDDDNDDESSDEDENSDEAAEYQNKRKQKKPKVADVVDRLIEKDTELTKRDLECRVRKLKMRHQIKSRILTL